MLDVLFGRRRQEVGLIGFFQQILVTLVSSVARGLLSGGIGPISLLIW